MLAAARAQPRSRNMSAYRLAMAERARRRMIRPHIDRNDPGDRMASLAGKTLFIPGGSRGIGRAIALRAARDGANVAIAAKTSDPHPKLAGTIHSVAEEMRKRPAARRSRSSWTCATTRRSRPRSSRPRATFGGIDILVNNASAISLTPTLATPAKRFDLMMARQRARPPSSALAGVHPVAQRRRRTRTSSTSRRRSTCSRAGSPATWPTRCPSTG